MVLSRMLATTFLYLQNWDKCLTPGVFTRQWSKMWIWLASARKFVLSKFELTLIFEIYTFYLHCRTGKFKLSFKNELENQVDVGSYFSAEDYCGKLNSNLVSIMYYSFSGDGFKAVLIFITLEFHKKHASLSILYYCY